MEKVSRGWSFSSVIRTSLLSYNCFLLLLVEVEGVGDSSIKEGREDEEERFFFSLSAQVSLVGATSLRRALTSSTSPFRTSFTFSFPFIKGFSPARILRIQSSSYLTCSFSSSFSSSSSSPLQACIRLSRAFYRYCLGERGGKDILGIPAVKVINFIVFFVGFWFSFLVED